MKRLYILVEGQSEEEFVKTILQPYMATCGVLNVTPILIRTSKSGKGGFVNYQHLKNDIKKLLSSDKDDFVVTMLVDFFRCPDLPNRESYMAIADHQKRVEEMERCMANDINDRRFIPYIQLHEFEALLFSSNVGFETYFTEQQNNMTSSIIADYSNPEDINSSPENAPSKRLLHINPAYEKVIEGNLIALEIGISTILGKCKRFREWIENLKVACM